MRTIILFQISKQELTKEQEQLARFAKALGYPIYIVILQMLANQSYCFHSDMSKILPIAKSTLSQRLNELKDAGLIQGTITLPTVKYCVNKKNLELAKILFSSFFQEVENTECE